MRELVGGAKSGICWCLLELWIEELEWKGFESTTPKLRRLEAYTGSLASRFISVESWHLSANRVRVLYLWSSLLLLEA